jgi:GT2 family glycosyltransferase
MHVGQLPVVAPTVTIVIVNWNGRAQLTRCLPSLGPSIQALGEPVQVVIVDNGSTDGSIEQLTAPDATWTLIRNPENRGFSAAVNQALAATESEFVALLNNDTVVHKRWLVELVAAMRANRSVGGAGAQLRYLGQPGRINSAGIEVDLTGRGRDIGDGTAAASGATQITEVFGVSAGAALYRRALFDDIGPFAEGFFAYHEDVDLAWRARRFGWRAVHVPTAVVLHEYSATAESVPGFKTYLSVRNQLWVLARNASSSHLVLVAPVLGALWSWTAVISLVRRDRGRLRGLRDGMKGWRTMRRSAPGPRLNLAAFERPRVGYFRAADRHRGKPSLDLVEPEIARLAASASAVGR